MPRIYFVLIDFGRLGKAYAECAPDEATWVNTIQLLAAGEWDRVLQVIEIDLSAGTSADVTDKARSAAALLREGVPMDCVSSGEGKGLASPSPDGGW